MSSPALYDFAPVAHIALVGIALALAPLCWIWARHRGASLATRLAALSVLTLFLTFDLVLFGAFTRLTDSGLGCPDWPGCYGNASPLGARHEIAAAQSALPSGPVTHGKAWVEMVHRYLATGVGVLILVMAVTSWVAARRRQPDVSPWWPTFTLAWVCLQGAFGAWTVTMKLYPAIVTGHLLGGVGLLMLLAAQAQGYRQQPLQMPRRLNLAVLAMFALVLVQVTLGGWVSTNYAVLACSEFPACQGSYWPPMDFKAGFTLLRPLGESGDGGYLPFAALTAIHYGHRLTAYLVLAAAVLLAWRLSATGQPALRRWAGAMLGVAFWQLLSGLANVVLGWPLVAAVAHTAGAAAWLTLLTVMIVRVRQARARAVSARAYGPCSPSGPDKNPHARPQAVAVAAAATATVSRALRG
jgi:cytochrome c oxidase assembly protein subunit 15